MEMLFAWIITLSLGIDALIVSASLGLRNEAKDKFKIALVFATAETLMPIAGIIIGGALGHYFNAAISAIGALLLIGVTVYVLFFEREEDEKKTVGRPLAGWTLMAVAIGISLDELAVGFTAGLMQVPIGFTITLIAAQSFAFSMLGLAFGAKLRRYLGSWAENVSGVVLGLTGVWMLIENWL